MKFTKITQIQWQHPTDSKSMLQVRFETLMFFLQSEMLTKTKQYYVKYVDNNTFERPWVDQESAEKYIQNQQALAVKYGGKILSFNIRDVDSNI